MKIADGFHSMHAFDQWNRLFAKVMNVKQLCSQTKEQSTFRNFDHDWAWPT